MMASKKQSRGCVFYGCAAALVVSVLLIAAAVAIGYGIKSSFNGLVEKYTDESPRELPMVTISDEELSGLKTRVEAFREAVKEGGDAPRLELTARDLNALIQRDAEFNEVAGKVYVDIEDDRLKGEVSIPLDDLNLGQDKQLYLNGSVVFGLSIDEGGLAIGIDAMEINGMPLPDQLMGFLQGKNVLEDAKLDDEAQQMIERIESLEITDGKILLELRSDGLGEVSEGTEIDLQ